MIYRFQALLSNFYVLCPYSLEHGLTALAFRDFQLLKVKYDVYRFQTWLALVSIAT